MERSGTLAEPSDNSMHPYRTQETDPFGSASFCVLFAPSVEPLEVFAVPHEGVLRFEDPMVLIREDEET